MSGGKKEKEKCSVLLMGEEMFALSPAPSALLPSASLSPSARGKCLVWALKGKSSQKGGLGHGQSPPLFPS